MAKKPYCSINHLHSSRLIPVNEIDIKHFCTVKACLSTSQEVLKMLEGLGEIVTSLDGRTIETRIACPFQETFSRIDDIYYQMMTEV
jgi:hypothetical protein